MVLTDNDSRLILHRLCQIQGIVNVNDFWFSRWLEELLQALLCLLGSFRFTWVGLYPLSSQILYNHGISVIVTRFTYFAENFVIRSFFTTKSFRSGHDCTGASSARSPNVVFTRYHLAAPKVIHEKNWKCLDVLEHFHQPVHERTPVTNLAHLATHHSVILRRHFFWGFRFLLIYATGLSMLMMPRSHFHF